MIVFRSSECPWRVLILTARMRSTSKGGTQLGNTDMRTGLSSTKCPSIFIYGILLSLECTHEHCKKIVNLSMVVELPFMIVTD